ncbi:MAG: hypothetical protein GY862_32015 [Gammaproteobacteria bacterium]|nr:hypothetical protein [Gammaproteobacteria bacterium]
MQRRMFLRKGMKGLAAICALSAGSLALLGSTTQAKPQNLASWKTSLESQIGFPLVQLQDKQSQGLRATFSNKGIQFSLYSKDAEKWFSAPYLL